MRVCSVLLLVAMLCVGAVAPAHANDTCEAGYQQNIRALVDNARACGISSDRLRSLTDVLSGPNWRAAQQGVLTATQDPDLFDLISPGDARWRIGGTTADPNCAAPLVVRNQQESFMECFRTFVCGIRAATCGRDLAKQQNLSCTAAAQQCLVTNPVPVVAGQTPVIALPPLPRPTTRPVPPPTAPGALPVATQPGVATQPPVAAQPQGIDAPRSGISGSTSTHGTGSGTASPMGAVVTDTLKEQDLAQRRRVSAALSPDDRARAKKLTSVGRDLLRDGERGAARVQLQRALDVDPADAETHFLMGETLAKDGDKEKAREHYTLASRLDPDSREGALGTARLQDLDRAVLPSPPPAVAALPPPDTLSAFQGTWCWTKGIVLGRTIIAGNRVEMQASAFGFPGRNAGTVAVRGERRLQITLPNSVQLIELIDSNQFHWIEDSGRPGSLIARRC